MDESAGRSAAEVADVETRGTTYLVLAAVKDGALSTEDGRDAIDAMIDHGWYVAPDVYTTIVGKLESLGD
jgi:predicted nucleic acid-binding protein